MLLTYLLADYIAAQIETPQRRVTRHDLVNGLPMHKALIA
jgi:hypothetical protein